MNALLGISWARGWSPRPDLTAEAILTAGAKGFDARDEAGGRSKAEVADFRTRLAVLTRSLEEEAQLNNLGRTVAYGMLTRCVRQRYALGRLWRQRPELLTTQLAPPIIVIGQMRGGTTRIHRLLAADPAHSATRFCDSWNPLPERPDLRPIKGAAALRMARVLNPWLDILHPMTATGVEEELGWLAVGLSGSAFYTQWHIPTFTRWGEEADPLPVYSELARILKTDAAHYGTAARPRVLKVPEFSEAIPALLKTWPDARLVVARRAPAEVADSAASLVAAQMAPQTDTADYDTIRAEWARKTALRESRMEHDLTACGKPLAVVDFAKLDADWRSAINGIYNALGLRLSAEAIAGMERMQRSARHEALGEHRRQRRMFATGTTRSPGPAHPSAFARSASGRPPNSSATPPANRSR
jgi:hypothetical protein